jgi:hypothetical protein
MAESNSWVRRGFSRSTSPARPARTCRPEVERLEDRLVLSQVGTPNQNYVDQLFLDLTGHHADPKSLASLSHLLDRKGPRARVRVVQAVENTSAYRLQEVKQAFQDMLGRQPTSAEATGALDYLQKAQPVRAQGAVPFLIGTGTFEQLEANLIASGEFFRKSGHTDNGFLRGVFRHVLGAEPGPASLRGFRSGLAAGSSRFIVGLNILDDTSAIQKQVQTFFRYLRRPSDSGTLNRLVHFAVTHDGSHPRQGVDLVLARLLATDEYFRLAQQNPPPLGSAATTRADARVVLTSSNNPALTGEAVTFTALVSPAQGQGVPPTGTVTFVEGSTVLATVTLSNGVASFTTSTLSVGNHAIVANYSGDAQFNPASATLAQTVRVPNARDVTLSPNSMPNPSNVGDAVTFSVRVAAATPGNPNVPGGQVQFTIDGQAFDTELIINGVATSSPTAPGRLMGGGHTIGFNYLGDADFDPRSVSLTQNVNPVTPTVTITAFANTPGNAAPFGQVTFTVTVSPPAGVPFTPTGSVTFTSSDATFAAATYNLSNGSVTTNNPTITLHGLNQTITVTYNGDRNFRQASTTRALQFVDGGEASDNDPSEDNPNVDDRNNTFV